MNWKEVLKKLEREQFWDEAIGYMQKIIEQYTNDLDAYLAINFLIMNLLVEEDYDEGKLSYYASLLKQYFDESWEKFSNNPEYLFYTGITAHISEWFFDITIEQAKEMILKAHSMESKNILYQWVIFAYLDMSNGKSRKKASQHAKKILENIDLISAIKSKGAIGDYIIQILSYQVTHSNFNNFY